MASNDLAISVRGVSKSYTIAHNVEKPSTLVETVYQRLKDPFKRSSKETFWALKDVSFDIKKGEVVGVIGRNGAGKSTILKILSRITEPTSGEIDIYGRVGSLLEVGTGFHPELTGRENVFLNGAILGMRKKEIARHFDAIVDFAEVEKFIDTPVKRYSSGMYVRLAFAVAAHLEPEILIVDEVLAVGDASFQKKCLGKLGDVAKHGRTVLFVSHNMGPIAQLCTKGILLRSGAVVATGPTDEVIEYYLKNVLAQGNGGFSADAGKNASKEMFVANARAIDAAGEPTTHFGHDDPITIEVTCRINQWVRDTVLGFYVRDHRGRKIFTSNSDKWKLLDPTTKEVRTRVMIPGDFLVPGEYYFTFGISVQRQRTIDWAEDVLSITIVDAGSQFAAYEGVDYGCVVAPCAWEMDTTENVDKISAPVRGIAAAM